MFSFVLTGVNLPGVDLPEVGDPDNQNTTRRAGTDPGPSGPTMGPAGASSQPVAVPSQVAIAAPRDVAPSLAKI